MDSTCFLVFLLALASATCQITEPDSLEYHLLQRPDQLKVNQPRYRLPTSVIPLKYNIRLVPSLVSFTFDGSVDITVKAVESVKKISFHVYRLKLDGKLIAVKELSPPHNTVAVTKVEEEEEVSWCTLNLGTALKENTSYVISIPKFTGVLNDEMVGFYRSKYRDNNTTRWLATTQFEATHARRAFPCFDEPALKARFTISISRPVNLHAISNMPQKGESQLDTEHTDVVRYWDHFEETPLMSTYLVAFVVSDFEHLDENMRIFAQPKMAKYTHYALSHSQAILGTLADYLNVSYDMPTMDQVAIPDFKAGAMENWGLVTYREEMLLINEANAPAVAKERTAKIIAHEFAHQWFGNLVSPEWWKFLWLSEGFANYFSYFALVPNVPGWRMDEQYVVSQQQSALRVDANRKIHSMTVNVSTPHEISAIFDTVSYAKAGSVIKMMESITTAESFRKGLTRYLNSSVDLWRNPFVRVVPSFRRDVKNVVPVVLSDARILVLAPDDPASLHIKSYSSATPEDLFDSLSEQMKKDNVAYKVDFKEVMRTWTLQAGYPVVNVTRDYQQDEAATLSQKRFLTSTDVRNECSQKWYVPLTHTNEAEADFTSTRPTHWLDPRDQAWTTRIKNLGANYQWVLFNIKAAGFYRVNYDQRNWELLTAFLKGPAYKKIPPVNRAQLLDDAFQLAKAEQLPYRVAFNLSTYLLQETDYIAWKGVEHSFKELHDKFKNTPGLDTFVKFERHLRHKTMETCGLKGDEADDQITRLNRAAAAKLACGTGEEVCVRAATASVAEWMQTPRRIVNPDLQEAFYCAAVRFGDSDVFDFLREQQEKCSLPSERDVIIRARGCSKDPELLQSFLAEAIANDSLYTVKERMAVFEAVYSNPFGLDVAFKFVVKFFRQVTDAFGKIIKALKIIFWMANSSNNLANKQLLEQLLDQYPEKVDSEAPMVVKAIEMIYNNSQWYKKYGEDICKWIEEYFANLPAPS